MPSPKVTSGDRLLQHRVVRSTAIPYVSNLNPTDTTPCFVTGSSDILTSIQGFCKRRPGFADNPEPTPTTFTSLKRTFTWDRTDGTFYVMFCDVNTSANTSKVYKMQFGTDSSAVLLYTDSLSSSPFDFVVSNNTVYFSNGNVAQKWDPINGVSNWGIAIGSVNTAVGPTIAGAGANSGTGVSWTNPNNVTVANPAGPFASVALSGANPTSKALQATTFGFAIPAGNTISGIAIAFKMQNSGANLTWNITMLKGGVPIGTTKSVGIVGGAQTITAGGSSDLWGTTWTPNDIDQANFGFQIVGQNSVAGTSQVNNFTITVYGTGGPTIAVNAGAGSMSATIGYQYVFCYGNSNTGHVSSPTPVSASTGVFTNKLKVTVTLTASTDSQVNQIRVYRSTDSVATGTSAENFFEIPNSPFPNSSGNIDDNAPDNQLIVTSIAPFPGFNDPPTPGTKPVYFSGRIWLNKGNKVYFSGLEETVTGVPEESFPSGVAGNFWAFDEPVTGQEAAGSGVNESLLVFCGGRVFGINGTSLETFRRFLISDRRGCRSLPTITSMGGMVAWLDTSGQIWASDGVSMQELGKEIRPDLNGLTQSNCSMTFHAEAERHWLMFSTGSKLFVFDLDTNQWMPPWIFSAQYVYSGETAAGTYKLIASTGTKAVQLTSGTSNNDQGSLYTPVIRTSLNAVVPDVAAIADQPSRAGYPSVFQIDTDGSAIGDVGFLADDDPLQPSATYTSIFANKTSPETAWNRTNGVKIVQNVFRATSPSSRWISWQVTATATDDTWKVYDWFMGYHELPGK